MIVMPFATIVPSKYSTVFGAAISKEETIVMIIPLSIGKTTKGYF